MRRENAIKTILHGSFWMNYSELFRVKKTE